MGKKEERRRGYRLCFDNNNKIIFWKKDTLFLSEPLSKYRNFQSFELFLMFAKSTFESSNQRKPDL